MPSSPGSELRRALKRTANHKPTKPLPKKQPVRLAKMPKSSKSKNQMPLRQQPNKNLQMKRSKNHVTSPTVRSRRQAVPLLPRKKPRPATALMMTSQLQEPPLQQVPKPLKHRQEAISALEAVNQRSVEDVAPTERSVATSPKASMTSMVTALTRRKRPDQQAMTVLALAADALL